MSRNAYILEAFKQFNSLVEEDESIEREEIPMYDVDSEHMHDFLDTVGDDTADVDVIDLEAEAEEDLKQSYVGKVILDCNVCHSNIFVNKEDVIVNEDGSANVDLECPYCMSNEGYTIIGQVEPYSEETEEEIDIEEEEPGEFDEVEEIDLGESFSGNIDNMSTKQMRDFVSNHTDLDSETVSHWSRKELQDFIEDIDDWSEDDLKDLGESFKRRRRRSKLREAIENVSIDTEDETMTMTTKEDGGIMIETSPRDSFTESDDFDFSEEELEEEPTDLEPGDEIIAPISNEDENEIELNSEVEALSDEDIETLNEPDDMSEYEDEIDIDEFDEESFNQLGESYLKRHYDNVSGFKTINAKVVNNSLIIEGIIKFNSGNAKGTSFTFEASNKARNNVLFEGYNKQISRGKKTFKMNCSLENGKLVPNRMTYNYMTKNELNESVRVNGTCRVK